MNMKNLSSSAIGNRIRRKAAREEMTASCNNANDGYGFRERLWWFGDIRTNLLQSPEQGLDDDQAMAFLFEQQGDSEEYDVEAEMQSVINGCIDSTAKVRSDFDKCYEEARLIEFLRESKKKNEVFYTSEGEAFAQMCIEDFDIDYEMFIRISNLFCEVLESGSGGFYRPLKMYLDDVSMDLASSMVHYFECDEEVGHVVNPDAYALGFMGVVSRRWYEIEGQI